MELPGKVKECMRECGGTNQFIKAIPGKDDLMETARTFSIISDEGRLQILLSLDKAPLCVCILKEITGLSDSKLSYHLGILKDGGMIEGRRDGKYIIYGLTETGKDNVKMIREKVR